MRTSRSARTRRAALAAFAVSASFALGLPGTASADIPNHKGVAAGGAKAAPVSPAYEAPRPVGGESGRKIG